MLDSDNFLRYARNSYLSSNPLQDKEFDSDMMRFEYLNKLFKRYCEMGDLNERLILNHIIILYNMFGNRATRLLLFKIKEEYGDALLTFLIYLNRLPEQSDLGPLDQYVIDTLRKI
jgi:hypothetical protein